MITKEQFDRINNCRESLKFVATQPDLATAWDKCERPDWLLTFAHKAGIISKEQAVRIAIGEAEIVLPIWNAAYPTDNRPAKAIEAAKAWLANPSVKTADAAYAVINAVKAAAYAAYATDAAYATVINAADAAAHVAYAVANVVHVVDAAADAARAATYAAGDTNEFKHAQCDRIRAIIPNPFR